jgi:hypothetical protein
VFVWVLGSCYGHLCPKALWSSNCMLIISILILSVPFFLHFSFRHEIDW